VKYYFDLHRSKMFFHIKKAYVLLIFIIYETARSSYNIVGLTNFA